MKYLKTLLILSLCSFTFGYGQISDLIISEYGEGSTGNNKYLELYNRTGAAIDLSDYEIWRVSNGGTWPEATLSLSGTLANGDAYLIVSSNTNVDPTLTAAADVTNAIANWNGNDAVGLAKDNGTGTFVLIDSIGEDGANPGVGWDVAGTTNATMDHTLVRKNNICSPNTNWSTSSGTTVANSEWIVNADQDWSNIGIHTSTCNSCTTTVIWDGTSWSNGTGPTITIAARISGDYDTSISNFIACSLTIDAGVTLTIADNTTLEVENDVINNGNISVLSQGAFLQINDAAVFINTNNNDDSRVTKLTAPIDAWYEYTYWSSPVQGELIQDTFFGTNTDRRYLFNASNYRDSFAETMNNNDTMSAGQDDVDDNTNDWQLYNTGVMQPGVGYSCTLSVISFNAGGGTGSQFAHIFSGPFNNGFFSVPVYRNEAELNDTNWNFIGNPYPSAISTDEFFNQNAYDTTTNPNGVLEAAVYLWSQNTTPNTNNNGNAAVNFDTSDYAIINRVGANGVGEDGNMLTNYVPSGQGFFVSMSDDYTNDPTANFNNTNGEPIEQGTVVFRNFMRVAGNNNQFFRTNNQTSSNDNKLWIKLTTDSGIYSQILVGYLQNATSADDGLSYDAIKYSSTNADAAPFLYTKIPNSDKKFSIQGKAESDLNIDEEITLGLFTSITEATLYTISIAQFQGDFFTNNTVYLEDSLMNVVHNLSNSDYIFTSQVGEFNNRFKIVFTTNTLSNNNFETLQNNLTIVELQNDNVKFTYNGKETIKSVKIIDVLGREVYNFRGSESTEIFNLSKLSNTVFLTQIELSNGKIITKKAIKK